MADADLEEACLSTLACIRQARLAQLKQQSGANDDSSEQEQKQDAEAAARQNILNQILTPDAADRLGRIRLVKASRANDVEARLISLARSGQIRQKVTETELKGFLEKVAESEEKQKGGKIEVVRRGGGSWDDDDDLEALLDD
ncbi:hypothetical protein BT63DRAFT_449391 [Microthyrium microscopicum]|uniref:DNA-binding TFAR19-related protein n=1 Tax=Microthyrium microscopicum TaxID=703497 RepID=A0A6A6UQ32_9PEZI|nr:hypothetical protein BT63DRAFT_449391 [Microthyrium microscopicum]